MWLVMMFEGDANVSDGCSGIGRVRRFCSVEPVEIRPRSGLRSAAGSRHDKLCLSSFRGRETGDEAREGEDTINLAVITVQQRDIEIESKEARIGRTVESAHG